MTQAWVTRHGHLGALAIVPRIYLRAYDCRDESLLSLPWLEARGVWRERRHLSPGSRHTNGVRYTIPGVGLSCGPLLRASRSVPLGRSGGRRSPRLDPVRHRLRERLRTRPALARWPAPNRGVP